MVYEVWWCQFLGLPVENPVQFTLLGATRRAVDETKIAAYRSSANDVHQVSCHSWMLGKFI